MKNILFLLLLLPLFSNATTLLSSHNKVQALRTAQPIIDKEHHIIDIGIFYTKDLLNSLSHEQLTAHIERQINAANVVMENSDLTIRRSVSYIGEYPIANQPDQAINSFLATVFNSQADQVRTLAQQFGFDYITILRPQSDENYCGWAYYDSPYALMEVGGNCTSATLGAHEWGHNDGADHDIANSSDTPLTEYGRGYNCDGNGTIMSTNHNWFTRHDFYSTPNKTVNSEVCGEENSANVVRMLNEFKDVSGHLGNRQEQPQQLANVIITTNSTIQLNEGGQASIELALVDDLGESITLDRDASVEITSQSGSALSGSDFSTLVNRINFSAGESHKTVYINTTADGIAEPAEYFSVSLRHGDIVNVSNEPLQITISESIGELNYQFSAKNISIQSEQSTQLTITRNGDLTQLSEVKLSHQLNWLTIDNEDLLFIEGQSAIVVKLSVGHLSVSSSGNLVVSSIDDSTVYDTVTVAAVLPSKEKSSGGAFFSLLLLLFSVKFLFIKASLLKNRHC